MTAEKETIRYSIVIPAYNADKTLSDTLIALKNQSVASEGYEVIVVDDGSTDETAAVAHRFDAHCITHQPNRGPAAARNRGVHVAKGSIVLFTDADCIPDWDWIRQMTLPFQNERTVGVKGVYRTRQIELAARFAQAEFEDRYDLLEKFTAIDMVDTYSAAFRRDVLVTIGLFDESFPGANNEDTELSYRLCAAGYLLEFNPRALVYHRHPDSFLKYFRLKFKRGYWRMVVYRNYPKKAIKDTYTPVTIKLQTLAAALLLTVVFCSFFSSKLLTVAGWLLLGIMASSAAFSIKTFKKDPVIGLLSPAVILGRAIVFALGSILGALRRVH
ncbi:MAG: glycosyltransferase [Deltaproteobacteria bacterium]|nr:glycosyltransferase [Deltaproteobacteria bacterium]